MTTVIEVRRGETETEILARRHDGLKLTPKDWKEIERALKERWDDGAYELH